jgi:hypothetical protein
MKFTAMDGGFLTLCATRLPVMRVSITLETFRDGRVRRVLRQSDLHPAGKRHYRRQDDNFSFDMV